MNKYPYRFVWHPRGKYKNLYRQRCRVLARGAMNSALVEFRNGRCVVCGGTDMVW